MNSDVQARIEHEKAELRGAYPRISTCHSALRNWFEDGAARYSLWLDIRWPQHQSIISGCAADNVERAVQAGFEQARRTLEQAHA